MPWPEISNGEVVLKGLLLMVEASSVVFGMPRAAGELDAADTVLGIDRIAESLTRYVFRNSEADKRRRRGNSI